MDQVQTSNQNSIPPAPITKKKSKAAVLFWGIKIIGVIAILVAIFVGFLVWATSDLVQVAEKQLAFLKNGDINAAYNLTSKDFQETLSLDDFKIFVAQFPYLSKNKSHFFFNRSIENSTSGSFGEIGGTLKSIDGEVNRIIFRFVKENNEWRIADIVAFPEEK